MSDETNLAIREPVPLEVVDPAKQMTTARNVAVACRDIALSTSVTIGQSKHVRVEGWQAVAIAYGCAASAKDVERIEGGWRAIGEVRRLSDGQVISSAEGFVGEDEPTWAKRTEHACRAMAQTRAISRACRSAFAHIIVMMNAGLSTTPAEEMPENGDEGRVQRQVQRAAGPPPAASGPASAWKSVVVPFGKNKGAALGSLPQNSLSWYIEKYEPKPYKGRISDGDAAFRKALDDARAEITGKVDFNQAREAVNVGSSKITPEEAQEIIEREAREAEMQQEDLTVPF